MNCSTKTMETKEARLQHWYTNLCSTWMWRTLLHEDIVDYSKGLC